MGRQQFQAAYILPAVYQALTTWAAGDDARKLQLQGLLRSISTFDVVTTLNLQVADEIDAPLAVITNLLTRGLPTMPSVHLEQQLANILEATERKDNQQFGSVVFHFKPDFSLSPEKLVAALHPIVPDPGLVAHFYDEAGLDSKFEKDFVTSYLKPAPFIAQVLEKQRSLETMVEGFSNGKVDFTLEVPYLQVHSRVNKYTNPVKLRHNRAYVIEVDGAAFHKQPIDDRRDYAVAQMSHTSNRIKEKSAYEDAKALLDELADDLYVQRLNTNFTNADFLAEAHTRLVLVPIAVARIQRVILSYLLSATWKNKQKSTLKLAVLERDIKAATLAVDDLNRTLQTFEGITKEDWARPQVQYEVYGSADDLAASIAEYDLVLDESMLRRTGIFAEDRLLMEQPNVIVLRNCHFVDDRTAAPVISAERISYNAPTDSEAKTGLTTLLQDIFRKQAFRVGQLPILKRALNGKSVIGLLPTGGGKSLTYQLAALLQPGLTVVVDPIRSLMADQDRSLRSNLIDKTTFVNSTLSTGERIFVQDELLPNGQLHFLFISPERFVIEEFRNVLTRCGEAGHFVAYVVIDEAHCVSEWGHDFRIPYLNLGENAQEFCPTFDKKPAPLFGLTATASFDVLADIERELKIKDNDGDAVVRFENTVRDEINYAIEHVNANFDLAGDPITKWDPNKIVGSPKQSRIFEIILGKSTVLQPYDDYATIRKVAQHSFQSYLSDTELEQVKASSLTPEEAKEWYCNGMAKRVWFGPSGPSLSVDDNDRFPYGIVVFAPHRTGWLGINNGNGSTGILGNAESVTTTYETLIDKEEVEHELPTAHLTEGDDRFGYFMGSSDDNSHAVAKNDLISFTHMDRFTANENSVMVATKAFGMGIDKPNIRMTIHINMPSSIESYVQEAGRGGRDRKSALSVVLFNDEKISYIEKGKEHTVNVDQEVLNFFHKRSFKGQMKERTMLFELRNQIRVPKRPRKEFIAAKLQLEVDHIRNININCGPDQADGLPNALFVNSEDFVDTHLIRLIPPYSTLGTQLTPGNWKVLREEIHPYLDEFGKEGFRNWLDEWVYPEGVFTGIERQFNELSVGEPGNLSVYFTNTFYSKPANEAEFHLNEKHLAHVYKNKIVDDGHPFATGIKDRLREAVFNDLNYEEFVELYDLPEGDVAILLNDEDPKVRQLQRAFYANRGPQDTSKAIYRLSSIGIIDTYTIDYNNKCYNLRFTKRDDDYYFLKLQELIARYTSNRRADFLVDKLREAKQPLIDAGKATPISVCLEYLTTYIYDNIRRKRKQAISDMIALCRQAVKIDDKLKQNLLVKDEIFYYFNAKYSRPDFVEPEVNEPASMPDDQDEDRLSTSEFIEKYLRLVEDADTGEFVNNNKHLRGSCMRMLRSYPDFPHYKILKSFSLFVISATTLPLREEAVAELSTGLLNWKKEEPDLNFVTALTDYRSRLARHVAFDLDAYLTEAINVANVRYYADWLHQFNNQLLPTNV